MKMCIEINNQRANKVDGIIFSSLKMSKNQPYWKSSSKEFRQTAESRASRVQFRAGNSLLKFYLIFIRFDVY